MGHGDQLLVVDRNYPAVSSGRPVVRLGEIGAERALTAILSVVPRLDFYDRAKQVFAVVHILETEPYSCFVLQKGVVFD